jgi:hypothetical protein
MMSLNETHTRIKSRIWQEIARARLDTSQLDKDTVETLVDIATSAALLEMDDAISRSLTEENEASADLKGMPSQSILDDQKEDVLWEGRPFLSLVLSYTITDERIRITEGLLGKARDNIELVRVQDMSYSQTFSERMLNIGDITIRSHDATRPNIMLKNIQDPESVYEILRRAVLSARKKHGFTYREEM